MTGVSTLAILKKNFADDQRIQGGDGLTLTKREVLTLILYTQTWQQK